MAAVIRGSKRLADGIEKKRRKKKKKRKVMQVGSEDQAEGKSDKNIIKKKRKMVEVDSMKLVNGEIRKKKKKKKKIKNKKKNNLDKKGSESVSNPAEPESTHNEMKGQKTELEKQKKQTSNDFEKTLPKKENEKQQQKMSTSLLTNVEPVTSQKSDEKKKRKKKKKKKKKMNQENGDNAEINELTSKIVEKMSNMEKKKANDAQKIIEELGLSKKKKNNAEKNEIVNDKKIDKSPNMKLKPIIKTASTSGDTRFQRAQLPIDVVEHQLMLELARHPTLVIIGETGSGKSTQVPQMCARLEPNGRIAVTQPRRVAAISLASRVAMEMSTEVGRMVGYQVRFENATTSATRIEYMTDGIVLRKTMVSEMLDEYSTIVIDEAHERSLHTDVLLCVLRQIQKKRAEGKKRPLRLVVMSATLQAEKFCGYFGAQAFVVEGRTHPIEMFYMKSGEKRSDYVFNAMVAIKKAHLERPHDEDVLVFLTGSEEIEAVARRIGEMNAQLPREAPTIMVVPLYAALRPEQQKLAFKKTPHGARKVILATNIAETSLTIPGIRVVIDTGKVKTKTFNAVDRVEILKVHDVSKAQAQQRAGRAGREAPGRCYRLYSRQDYEAFDEENVPEILRSNLAASYLELMKLGMRNPHRLRLIDEPSRENVDASVLELISLNAIRPLNSDYSKFALTQQGEAYCRYPLPPDHARILIHAEREGCIMEAIKIVASMQTESIWSMNGMDDDDLQRIRRRFETREGDHLTMLRLIMATNDFFDELNRKTRKDPRYEAHEASLQREYARNIKRFCDDNGINEQHLKTASMIEEQLMEIAIQQKVKFSSCGADLEKLRKAMALGLFLNSCEYDRQEDRYRLMINPSIMLKIHPTSSLARSKPSCIVFSQLVRTTELYAMQVTLIDADWVRPLINTYKKMKMMRNGEMLSTIVKRPKLIE